MRHITRWLLSGTTRAYVGATPICSQTAMLLLLLLLRLVSGATRAVRGANPSCLLLLLLLRQRQEPGREVSWL